MRNLTRSSAVTPELAALQLLVNRCPSAEEKKWLIVTAGSCEAIDRFDACLMISANMLEAA